VRIENPRRLRYEFEMRDDASGTLVAEGFVRVACVDLTRFTPRDLPREVKQLVEALPALAERQGREGIIPWA
jgi:acyl-CoA thioesterase FadM